MDTMSTYLMSAGHLHVNRKDYPPRVAFISKGESSFLQYSTKRHGSCVGVPLFDPASEGIRNRLQRTDQVATGIR
jgi:hypothetical protein